MSQLHGREKEMLGCGFKVAVKKQKHKADLIALLGYVFWATTWQKHQG